MSAKSLILILLPLTSAFLSLLPQFPLPPAHAQSTSSSLATGRITVGFLGNTRPNALYISSKFNLPIITENDVLQFALFAPPSAAAFLSSVRHEPVVRYAEEELLYCFAFNACGGGGGGGGAGSSPPDFSISASPTSLTVPVSPVGTSTTSTITVSSLNGYSGTVGLSTSVSSSGLTASLNPSSVTLSSGGSGSSTLTVSTAASTPVGSYIVTVTGVGGTVGTHSISLSMSVTSDFGITATPVLLTITGGSSGTSTVTLTSLGFSGTVSLTVAAAPVVANSPTPTLNPTSVTVSPGGTGSSTLTVTTGNTPSGGYTVTVTGISGSISHTVSIAVSVPFPNDPLVANQWGIPDLNLPGAWTRTIGTRARVVAIVDSGIMFDHPDLQGNLWTAADGSHGWNCVANPQNNNAADDFGHGTLVAGVVAAVINNGVGIAGVAQEQLMSVKVADATGFATDVTEACGIQWAVDHGANVINLSLGGPGTTTMEGAVQYAWNQEALLVAAVGNNAADSILCPACYGQVIAVSALQQGDTRACFTNYGIGPTTGPSGGTNYTPELTAPGVNILSTNWPPNTLIPSTNFGSCGPAGPSCLNQLYCAVDGTSFATPFISGLAALAWDYNLKQGPIAFTNQQIRTALDSYVTGPNSNNSCGICHNYYGYGKPDAGALLSAMVSTHSYTLTANWFFGPLSGTEGSAGVLLQDITDPANWKWITPCCTVPHVGNGLTVSIMAGHRIYVYFTAFFNDGSNWVYLHNVNSVNVPTYSDNNSLACGVNFVFPPVSASSEGDYFIALNGNPYAGMSCTQAGVAK